MAIDQSIQPTVLEPGAVYSEGILDHPLHVLTQVKEKFVIPDGTDSTILIFCNRLKFLRGRIFMLLDTAFSRLKIHREQLRRISQQLENGTKRYDDLPQPPIPFEHHGPTPDIDKIRQKILDERARLLEEERRLDSRYWSDVTDVKANVAEALAEYVGLASRVESHIEQLVPVPNFEGIFGFLEAPAPDEVLIHHGPTPIEDLVPERVP